MIHVRHTYIVAHLPPEAVYSIGVLKEALENFSRPFHREVYGFMFQYRIKKPSRSQFRPRIPHKIVRLSAIGDVTVYRPSIKTMGSRKLTTVNLRKSSFSWCNSFTQTGSNGFRKCHSIRLDVKYLACDTDSRHSQSFTAQTIPQTQKFNTCSHHYKIDHTDKFQSNYHPHKHLTP